MWRSPNLREAKTLNLIKKNDRELFLAFDAIELGGAFLLNSPYSQDELWSQLPRQIQQQKAIFDSGRWLLYRYDLRRTERGENPLILDSRTPKQPVEPSICQNQH
ncbi:MAG: hypothetical protein AAGE96_24515 [Cyanobacteria bacterium P01_G01_bin.19]